jgi:Domain of unknown function (DUF3482)/50S ribosome-binding GTPase
MQVEYMIPDDIGLTGISHPMIPEFAIIGHPNEGKSSVLSTLAEDDSVRISPTPGETTRCRTFPVIIDGVEILRFTDTPGFQNPRRVLHELKAFADIGPDMVRLFRKAFSTDAELRDDYELLGPVARGAGIIYVVDGSRPVRNIDRVEMEILRLTGKPRMAVINCKEEDTVHLADWKNEFRKNFNSNRVFNAHRATYAERILLLEALKSIDQDWHQPLDLVVSAFKRDWAARNDRTAGIILDLLFDCLSFKIVGNMRQDLAEKNIREKLQGDYIDAVRKKERQAHGRIRALFKHNIFNYDLPPCSILHEDLFNRKTWQFLGLGKKQMALAGAVSGAAIGAGFDLAHAGLTFGIFTTIGGAVGTVGAILGGRSLSTKTKLLGVGLGGEQMQVGPNASIQFLHVLLDRALLFYAHVINWAHGRRDAAGPADEQRALVLARDIGSGRWPAVSLEVCRAYFLAIREEDEIRLESEGEKLHAIITDALDRISHGHCVDF